MSEFVMSKYATQDDLYEAMNKRICELEEALATRSKQIGVACMKHDLVHSLVCGICFSELEQQRDELVEAAAMAVEMIETNAHERRHVRWKLKDAIAKVKP